MLFFQINKKKGKVQGHKRVKKKVNAEVGKTEDLGIIKNGYVQRNGKIKEIFNKKGVKDNATTERWGEKLKFNIK